MRYLLVFTYSLLFSLAFAQGQTSYTQYLQRQVAGQGRVTIIQDEEIDALVNNMPKEDPREPAATMGKTGSSKSAKSGNHNSSSSAGASSSSAGTPSSSSAKQADTTVSVSSKYTGTRTRHKTKGYRIQVYSGTGNSAAKAEAKAMESKIRRAFPELAVYCHFKSPRWVCRVGDFATREEAQRYLTKIRKQKISIEASIVSDEVLIVQ